MKKITLCCMAAFLSLTFHPITSSAAAVATSQTVSTNEAAEANALLLRLDEIKQMDKSNLNPVEKKTLRTEVLAIKKRLTVMQGGIFISAGALIVIIILLIILL